MISSVLFVGFSIVNSVVVFSPGCNLPPNQLVIGNVLSEIPNLSIPIELELNECSDVSITSFMFENVASLCTINFPPCPYTVLTAFRALTMPVPCVIGSFLISSAVDIRIFLILNGSYSIPLSFKLSARRAALPATMGADILVPPKSLKGSLSESLEDFVTNVGTKPYAPILIRSGFVSPIIPGPLLEKSTT